MGQTHVTGATMPHYVHEQVPGIDILCRRTTELLTVKQTASVAHQWGRNRLICETVRGQRVGPVAAGPEVDRRLAVRPGRELPLPAPEPLQPARRAQTRLPAEHMPHQPWWPQYNLVEDYFGAAVAGAVGGRAGPRGGGDPPDPQCLGGPGAAVRRQEGWRMARRGANSRRCSTRCCTPRSTWTSSTRCCWRSTAGRQEGALKVNKAGYRIIVVPEMTHMAPDDSQGAARRRPSRARRSSIPAARPIKVYDAKVPGQDAQGPGEAGQQDARRRRRSTSTRCRTLLPQADGRACHGRARLLACSTSCGPKATSGCCS